VNRDLALAALRRDLEEAACLLGAPQELRFRSMFGGLMAYFGEQPCAWLSAGGLALKLAPADQPGLLEQPGARRLVAKPGAAPSRSYVLVPAAIHRDAARLAPWLARSTAAAKARPRRSRIPRR
jgi:TfoX/Sxy family transcriptional regulator of competence genes